MTSFEEQKFLDFDEVWFMKFLILLIMLVVADPKTIFG